MVGSQGAVQLGVPVLPCAIGAPLRLWLVCLFYSLKGSPEVERKSEHLFDKWSHYIWRKICTFLGWGWVECATSVPFPFSNSATWLIFTPAHCTTRSFFLPPPPTEYIIYQWAFLTPWIWLPDIQILLACCCLTSNSNVIHPFCPLVIDSDFFYLRMFKL